MSISQITHISSLKDICRCCHSNGKFKSLKEPCIVRGKVEVYYQMIIETFGIRINPQIKEASYTICDECIVRLRDSTTFRNQVEACEEKFNQYSQLFFNPVDTKVQFRNHNYIENKTLHVEIEVENVDSELKIKNDSFIHLEILNNNDEVLDVDHKEKELGTVQYKLENVIKTDEFKNLCDDLIESENTVDPYKKHLTRNKNEKKKYKCNDCGCLFVCLKRLKVHSRTIHNKLLSLDEYKNADKVKNGFQNAKFSNYLKCRFCDKKIPEYYYERHLKTHVGKTECINCGIIFESTDLLKEHSKKHKYENMHTCDICKKRFIGKSTLKRHIDLHHMGKGRKFMCHECGVFFNDITNLRSHTTTVHMKLRMFECSVCQKKLASKKTLKVHMRTHTGERPYVCDECGDGFICFTKLKIHKIKHDVMKKYGAKYVCKICHSTFHGQGLLTHHVKSEHPGRLPITINKRKYLPCPSCNKVFSQKYSFDRHMTKHGVIDKVPCKICNKMLIDKFSLYRHNRNIHTSKEKVIKEKVQCSLCKRKVQDIENHMKVHTVRPMKCETCGKNYPDPVTLHRHVMNVHLDVNKIFQCKKCDRRPYSRRENLRSHMLKKHGCDLNAE